MTPHEAQVYEWFKQYGVVIPLKSDPRGEYWVRGYLSEITAMIVDQIERAEKRGESKSESKPRRHKGGKNER